MTILGHNADSDTRNFAAIELAGAVAHVKSQASPTNVVDRPAGKESASYGPWSIVTCIHANLTAYAVAVAIDKLFTGKNRGMQLVHFGRTARHGDCQVLRMNGKVRPPKSPQRSCSATDFMPALRPILYPRPLAVPLFVSFSIPQFAKTRIFRGFKYATTPNQKHGGRLLFLIPPLPGGLSAFVDGSRCPFLTWTWTQGRLAAPCPGAGARIRADGRPGTSFDGSRKKHGQSGLITWVMFPTRQIAAALPAKPIFKGL